MAKKNTANNLNDSKSTITMARPSPSRWTVVLFIMAVLLLLSFGISSLISTFDGDAYGNVAIIKVEGTIIGSQGSLFGSDGAVSGDIVELIKKADETQNIEAIIIEVNSPGGSAVASDEIGSAIKKVNKTTVTVIREVGASGGYWIASAADHVIANRMSITGSIGVIGSYLGFAGLLENYNITYERFVAGEQKDIGTPFKDMTSEERAIIQAVLDEIHSEFINEVAENRGMAVEEVTKIATGRFMTGSEALKLGLVDELGGMDEAVAYLESMNITVDLVEYKQEETLADILASIINTNGFSIGQGIGSAFTSRVGAVSIRT